MDAIAQVDHGTPPHPHQAQHDLGGMATQILAASLARRTDADLPVDGAVLRQFVLPGLEPADRVVPTAERPPAERYLR
jgi:glucosyl-3-phosphoglycerate synthase